LSISPSIKPTIKPTLCTTNFTNFTAVNATNVKSFKSTVFSALCQTKSEANLKPVMSANKPAFGQTICSTSCCAFLSAVSTTNESYFATIRTAVHFTYHLPHLHSFYSAISKTNFAHITTIQSTIFTS
jgi:hypothetical protein